jgi:hypothetical protein
LEIGDELKVVEIEGILYILNRKWISNK